MSSAKTGGVVAEAVRGLATVEQIAAALQAIPKLEDPNLAEALAMDITKAEPTGGVVTAGNSAAKAVETILAAEDEPRMELAWTLASHSATAALPVTAERLSRHSEEYVREIFAGNAAIVELPQALARLMRDPDDRVVIALAANPAIVVQPRAVAALALHSKDVGMTLVRHAGARRILAAIDEIPAEQPQPEAHALS